MPLTWADFRWTDFFRRLGWTAWGGFVVTLALLSYTKYLKNPPLAGAANLAFEEFKRGVAAPNEFVLVGVLVLTLVYLVCTGSPALDGFAKVVIRPAIDFCRDASCLGFGVLLVFALSEWGDAGFNLLIKALWLVLAAAILNGANALVAVYAGAAPGSAAYPGAAPIPQQARLIVSGTAFIALVVVIALLPKG